MNIRKLFASVVIILSMCSSAVADEWAEYTAVVKVDLLSIVGKLSHQQSYFYMKFNDEPYRSALKDMSGNVCNCDSVSCSAGLPTTSDIFESTYSLLLSAAHSNKSVQLTLYTDPSKTINPFSSVCTIKEASLVLEE